MSIELVIEILIKVSLVLLLGLAVRMALSKASPMIRHLVVLTSLIGALAMPVIIPTIWFSTPVQLPKELGLTTPSPAAPIISVEPHEIYRPQIDRVYVKTNLTVVLGVRLWLLGVCLVALRYLGGLLSLAKVRRQSTLVELTDGAEVRISHSHTLKTAMTWGVRKPVILLPSDARMWPAQRLEMVLTHEFAHLRRRDFASQILAEVACALYWFHPLVWFATRALREDAEQAADNAVIRRGVKPTDYAEELLQIAVGLNRKDRPLVRAGIAYMNHSQIESRLKAILTINPQQKRGTTVLQTLALLAAAGATISALASLKVQDQDKDPKILQTVALSKIKQLTTATIIYAADYDDVYPYVSSTADAKKVTYPYTKNNDIYKSPRKGAEFRYNVNIGGSQGKFIEELAQAPMWYEVVPTKDLNPVVGYADGHAKVTKSDQLEVLAKALKKVHPRERTSKPVKVH